MSEYILRKQIEKEIEDAIDLGALLLHAQVTKELTLEQCVERQKAQIKDVTDRLVGLVYGDKETEQ